MRLQVSNLLCIIHTELGHVRHVRSFPSHRVNTEETVELVVCAQGGDGDVWVTLRHQLRSGGGCSTTTFPDNHEQDQKDDQDDQDNDDHNKSCVAAVLHPWGCCHVHDTRRGYGAE